MKKSRVTIRVLACVLGLMLTSGSTFASELHRKTFYDPMYSGTTRYYLVANLPSANGGTGEGVMIEVTGKEGSTQGKGKLKVALGQRGGFWYRKSYEGDPMANIVVYKNAGGDSNVYIYIDSAETYVSAEVLYYQFGWQAGGNGYGATLYDNPSASSSTPSGVLIFNSNDEVTYPVNDTISLGSGYYNNIGIGTTNPGVGLKLDVVGKVRAHEIIVNLDNPADFVFEEDYNLPTLNQVESFIKENKHLPDIPSGKEIKGNGIGVSEMLAKQMQKIEELTLYVIDQNKKLVTQNKKIEELEKKLAELENEK